MLMKKKTILGITTFVILGVIIALFLYITFPSLKNKRTVNNNNGGRSKTLIGVEEICKFDGTTKFYKIESDFTGNKPDITSNTINIDTSKLLSLIQNNGCEIVINDNTINNIYRYNITRIDANKNTITFNAPENFQLSSAEAWPIHIIYCNKLQPPEIIR